jgi:hypothetical protein
MLSRRRSAGWPDWQAADALVAAEKEITTEEHRGEQEKASQKLTKSSRKT